MMKFQKWLFLSILFIFISCNENNNDEALPNNKTTESDFKKLTFTPSARWLAYSLPDQVFLLMEQNLHNPRPIALLNIEGTWHESTYQYNKYKGFLSYKIDYQINNSIHLAKWDGILYQTDSMLDKETAQACKPIENQAIVHIKGKIYQKKNVLILEDNQEQGNFYFIENRNYEFLKQAYNKIIDQGANQVVIEIEAYFNQGKIAILHMGALREEDF